jgi:bacterial leucyl aminopeptidase
MSTYQTPAEARTALTAEEVFTRVINPDQLLADVMVFSLLTSRHIDHPGNVLAVELLVLCLQGMSRFEVTQPDFPHPDPNEARRLINVEARLPGVGALANEILVVSAHLDSTAGITPGYQPRTDPAPGADDDASGIAGVLAAARAIGELSSTHTGPRRQIRFLFFNAEEQRQTGSYHYCETIADPAFVKGVYHLDMIGYDKRAPRLAEVHAGVPEDSSAGPASEVLAGRVTAAAGEVAPGLLVVTESGPEDEAVDFSDHTRFHERHMPACLITANFFTGNRDVNLDYHLAEDTRENINPTFGADVARAVAAAAWRHAITP